jgi:hypothetical protein
VFATSPTFVRLGGPESTDSIDWYHRESFHEVCIDCLPGQEFANLKDCVWNGPQGFSSKPALLPVYDDELAQLFKQILKVPDVTTEEILEYLKQLKDDKTTTMTDVVEAYVFLHENCKDS